MYLFCMINTILENNSVIDISAFIRLLKTPLCWMDLFVNIFPFVLCHLEQVLYVLFLRCDSLSFDTVDGRFLNSDVFMNCLF